MKHISEIIPEAITEKVICDELNRKFIGNCRYKVANVFVFRRDWESDFFVQKDNGYAYEFEVKVSRSDFFNDKKKVDKHLILETGKYISKSSKGTWNVQTRMFDYEEVSTEETHEFRPNRFYYVVPKNLITADEVPGYAGLMYYHTDGRLQEIITVKEAPFIHKDKLNFEGKLCNKFYHYWINSKIKIREMEDAIKHLKEKLHIAQNVQVSDTTMLNQRTKS